MLKEYNDYELIALSREGNEEAINILYQKYKPIIVSKSADAIVVANHHGVEISDIMQEGFIGLEEAINGFSEKVNTSFYTFAVLCINRQIINYLRKVTYGKNRLLNDAVNIDEYVDKEFKDSYDTEISLIAHESEKEFLHKVQNHFTELENNVFKLKMDGYNFEEIAHILNKDVKSIYNTFQRVKSKIKKIIENDDYL